VVTGHPQDKLVFDTEQDEYTYFYNYLMPKECFTMKGKQTALYLNNGVFWDLLPDEESAKFFRNVGSYKSHTA
jgi:hypothetical protein